MRTLQQKRPKPGMIFPSPRDGEVMFETPPTLCWVKEDNVAEYTAVIRKGGETVWQGKTERNFIVPDIILEPSEEMVSYIRQYLPNGAYRE